MVRANEPHKTSETPRDERTAKREDDEAPEWRGGNRPQEEARQRSSEDGWGRPTATGDKPGAEEEE